MNFSQRTTTNSNSNCLHILLSTVSPRCKLSLCFQSIRFVVSNLCAWLFIGCRLTAFRYIILSQNPFSNRCQPFKLQSFRYSRFPKVFFCCQIISLMFDLPKHVHGHRASHRWLNRLHFSLISFFACIAASDFPVAVVAWRTQPHKKTSSRRECLSLNRHIRKRTNNRNNRTAETSRIEKRK